MADMKPKKEEEAKKEEAVETADEVKFRAMARAIAEETALAMGAVMRGQNGSQVSGPKPGPVHTGPTCSDCKQALSTCKSKHVKMVVFPVNNPEYADWFQGYFLNGVRYLSNNSHHRIWVPAEAEGEILHSIQNFATNERETRIGRTKSHNSGDISNPKPVNDVGVQGWR